VLEFPGDAVPAPGLIMLGFPSPAHQGFIMMIGVGRRGAPLDCGSEPLRSFPLLVWLGGDCVEAPDPEAAGAALAGPDVTLDDPVLWVCADPPAPAAHVAPLPALPPRGWAITEPPSISDDTAINAA